MDATGRSSPHSALKTIVLLALLFALAGLLLVLLGRGSRSETTADRTQGGRTVAHPPGLNRGAEKTDTSGGSSAGSDRGVEASGGIKLRILGRDGEKVAGAELFDADSNRLGRSNSDGMAVIAVGTEGVGRGVRIYHAKYFSASVGVQALAAARGGREHVVHLTPQSRLEVFDVHGNRVDSSRIRVVNLDGVSSIEDAGAHHLIDRGAVLMADGFLSLPLRSVRGLVDTSRGATDKDACRVYLLPRSGISTLILGVKGAGNVALDLRLVTDGGAAAELLAVVQGATSLPSAWREFYTESASHLNWAGQVVLPHSNRSVVMRDPDPSLVIVGAGEIRLSLLADGFRPIVESWRVGGGRTESAEIRLELQQWVPVKLDVSAGFDSSVLGEMQWRLIQPVARRAALLPKSGVIHLPSGLRQCTLEIRPRNAFATHVPVGEIRADMSVPVRLRGCWLRVKIRSIASGRMLGSPPLTLSLLQHSGTYGQESRTWDFICVPERATTLVVTHKDARVRLDFPLNLADENEDGAVVERIIEVPFE